MKEFLQRQSYKTHTYNHLLLIIIQENIFKINRLLPRMLVYVIIFFTKEIIIMKNTNLKKIVFLSILLTIAVVLSIVDKSITLLAFPYLPTAKIGLANIIILTAIIKFDFKDSLLLVILKSVLANLLFGGLTSFIIGGSASLLSFLGMQLTFRFGKKYLSSVGVSVIGGFIHIITQLFITATIYHLGAIVLFYGALLVIVSLITSIIIGLLVNKVSEYKFIGI